MQQVELALSVPTQDPVLEQKSDITTDSDLERDEDALTCERVQPVRSSFSNVSASASLSLKNRDLLGLKCFI